jgi:hypothetical protein
MSVVSDRHSIVPFVAGKTAAFTDQRLCKVGYKSTAKNPAAFPSVAVSVPFIADADILERVERLIPHVRVFLGDVQDKIVRSLYESSDGALTSVHDDEISVSQCIAFLETESNGGRLTKESVYSWFDSEVKDNLSVVIADKIGAELESSVVAQKLHAYREVIGSLSNAQTLLQPAQIKSVRSVLGLCAESGEIGAKLIARLDSMENVKPIAELLEL